MGGRDDDARRKLEEWLEVQRAQMSKSQHQVQDALDRSLSSPFERFKNFIDDKLSTLSEGVRNFPSNVTELKARMQAEREARMEEERDIWRRWTGSDDSPDHITMQVERSSRDEREAAEDAAYILLRQCCEKNKHVSPTRMLKLYLDDEGSSGSLDRFATPMLSSGGACYYKSETVENLPSTARWGWPTPKPQWLSIDWFKRSPYSPIRLEAHPDLSDSGAKWRAAFEDLLNATLDKPMVLEERIGVRSLYGTTQSTAYGPGLEWMLSLQCRGILPPQLPKLYKEFSVLDVCRPGTAESIIADIHTISRRERFPPGAIFWKDTMKEDVKLLADEISIKSGPDTISSFPLPARPPVPWKVADTEVELYENMPPVNVGRPKPKEMNPPPSQEDEEDLFDDDEEYEEEYNEHDPDYDYDEEDEFDDDEDDEDIEPDLPLSRDLKKLAELAREWAEHELVRQQRELAELEAKDEGRQAKLDAEERQAADDAAIAPQAKRPDILSQLTTTQTTRLPDGTVTTKVVLKQKFADGREEEHESVHTTTENARPPTDGQKTDERASKDPKRKGWFWS